MSINEKKEDLIGAIIASVEYEEYQKTKAILKNHPELKEHLDEYKKLLLETQLGQFLGEDMFPGVQEELDSLYTEISGHKVVNQYLMAEYKLKNLIQGIYQDLGHIIDNGKEGRSNFYI